MNTRYFLDALRSNASRARGIKGVLTFKPDNPMSVARNLEHWAAKTPKRTFLKFEGRTWSFGRFNEHVGRRGAALRKLGIGRGDHVALIMSNRPDFIIDAIALNRIGAVPALVNINLRGTGLRHAVMVAEPKAVMVDGLLLDPLLAAFADHEEFNLPIIVNVEAGTQRPAALDSGLSAQGVTVPLNQRTMIDLIEIDDAMAYGAMAPLEDVKGTDTAAFIYTSGTTGLPKAGKVLNARVELAGLGWGLAIPGLRTDDTVYCCLPMFHSNGFMVSLGSALVAGASYALARRFSASRFWADIARSEATAFIYIGEICRYLLNSPEHPEEASHSLRYIIGNGMRAEIWPEFTKRFKIPRVHEFYGATEGNVNMINPTGKMGSVGRMPPGPLNNALVVRFDHDLQEPVRDTKGRCIPCAPDEAGELLGRINPKLASQRFDGYLNKEATSKKILRDVLKEGDAYFRSGDLLSRDSKGWFYFVDRIGDTFRWKGENVSTNEVADAVARHPSVEIANVYGVEVPHGDGRAGMAAVVVKKGDELEPTGLFGHVVRELPAYAQPAFVRVVDTASLTATFKLRKVDLQREAFDLSAVTDTLLFRDDAESTYSPLTEESLAKIEAGEIRF